MTLPREIVALLVRSGLLAAEEEPQATALAGGVSSDIWRVDLAGGTVCVKRALPRLKVVADWRAPVDRNAYEVAWLEIAGSIVPEGVPRVLARDPTAGFFVMEYLDPARYRVWKEALRQGAVDSGSVQAVAEQLVRIHAATAGDAVIAQRFATDAIFHAIRLEPYLAATARKHPDLAAVLLDLIGHHRADEASAGPRRRQPKKHPPRTRGSRFSSMRNAPGTAILPSISRFASITCS